LVGWLVLGGVGRRAGLARLGGGSRWFVLGGAGWLTMLAAWAGKARSSSGWLVMDGVG